MSFHQIQHVKLLTGEDIFGQVVQVTSDKIVLKDTLVMEVFQSEEATKYMYMSRYTPFAGDNNVIEVPRSAIVFSCNVQENVAEHYDNALKFAIRHSDCKFKQGIENATNFLRRAIEEQLTDDDIADEEPEWAEYSGPTKH